MYKNNLNFLIMFAPPPIGVLYVGGHPRINNQRSCRRWFAEFSELGMLIVPDAHFIASSLVPVTVPELATTARWIKRRWKQYAGFIIVFDHIDFLYHANILSFMLGQVGKPIVSTSTLTTLTPTAADIQLKSQLLNAAITVISPLSGSMIVKDAFIVPVHHARLQEVENGLTVRSADSIYYGTIDFGVHLTRRARGLSNVRPVSAPVAATHVTWQQLSAEDPLVNQSTVGSTAVIIEHPGASLATLLKQDLPRGIPSLLIGADGAAVYGRRRWLRIPALTPEAAAAKFVWALGLLKHHRQRLSLSQIHALMQQPVLNEFLT